mmetsp:Transcript_108638/g.303623  ORF Transcript_108638/g.303623 Transcript_108638/m.303623 type:complete len:213 (+) Transcript_108638:457-1095(+)
MAIGGTGPKMAVMPVQPIPPSDWDASAVLAPLAAMSPRSTESPPPRAHRTASMAMYTKVLMRAKECTWLMMCTMPILLMMPQTCVWVRNGSFQKPARCTRLTYCRITYESSAMPCEWRRACTNLAWQERSQPLAVLLSPASTRYDSAGRKTGCSLTSGFGAGMPGALGFDKDSRTAAKKPLQNMWWSSAMTSLSQPSTRGCMARASVVEYEE